MVYALNEFRGYVFGHDCFNPETINKYCYICVTSSEATVTSTERDLHGFGIHYRFCLTCGRCPLYKQRFLDYMYLTNYVTNKSFNRKTSTVISALLHVTSLKLMQKCV